MQLKNEFREKVRTAILTARENFGGSDSDYSKKLGIGSSIYSRLKSGEVDKLLSDTMWLTIGRELNVNPRQDNWKVARTQVYSEIEDNLNFCKEFSKSMILVDDCGIGKTFCTKHILSKLKNGFYIDCSQAKTKQQFIRLMAKTVGVSSTGKYIDVKNNLKYALTILESPVIALDEIADLEPSAFLEVKEMWNATEAAVGWYMIGADGLRAKIEKGINGKKVGYAEIFSRFSDTFIKLVPIGKEDRVSFYSQLIGTVASVNLSDKTKINENIKKCLKKDATLRYLETLIKAGI